MEIRTENLRRNISLIVMASLIFAFIFSSVELTLNILGLAYQSTSKANIMLVMFQSIIGLACMFVPSMLERRLNLQFSPWLFITYTIFLYASIFLGEIRNYYYVYPYWDSLLHCFSGVMLAILGYSLIKVLNKTDRILLSLSPIFVAIFSFCFALTLGTFWEIIEFSGDLLLGTNMQKYMNASGECFVGQEALSDTMKDLIVDSIGAFAVCTFGYIAAIRKKKWLKRFQIIRKIRKSIKLQDTIDEIKKRMK